MKAVYRNQVGENISINGVDIIGVVTDQYEEDNAVYIVIDDLYEDRLSNYELVWDLTNGMHYLRGK